MRASPVEDVVGELQSILDVSRLEAGIYLSVMDELVSETMPKVFTERYLENEKKALLQGEGDGALDGHHRLWPSGQ